MTIASEITRINTNIANAYTACNGKGATMPVTQNSANLATCINSISGGSGTLQSKTLEVSSATPTVSVISPDSGYDGLSSVTVDMTYIEDRLDTVLGSSVVPTGTINITVNGVYDVTNYASADVSVSGGGGTEVAYIFTNLSPNPPSIYLTLGNLDTYNDSARVLPQATNSIGNFRTGYATTYYWKIEPNTNYSLFQGLSGAYSNKIKTVNINTGTIDMGEYSLGGGDN